MKNCSIIEAGKKCDKAARKRGWCNMHYERWRTHGDPLWTPPSESERFSAKVNWDGPMNPILGTPCWLWTSYKDRDGYGTFRLEGVHAGHIGAHRWSLAKASGMFWPGFVQLFQVDHRCHNHACVRPDHLRPATHKQNCENLSGLTRRNMSGVRGVTWNKRLNRWQAQFQHNGKNIHVGLFDTVAEAEAAIIAARCSTFTHNDLDREVAS